MSRYLALALIALTLPAFATERVKVDPYIKAGPGYTAANGSITGYVPSKSNDQLLLEAERKGWLGSGSAKTPVTVKPKVTIPVGGLASKLKSGLKTNVGQLVLGAAVSGAVAGVGWVMSDDNTKIQKKQNSPPSDITGNYKWVFLGTGGYPYYKQVFNGASPGGLCSEGTQYWSDYNKNTATILSVEKISDTSYACKVSFTSSGFVYKPTWVMTRQGSGCTAPAVYDEPTSSCVITALSPISDSDYDLLDPWIAQQSASWLKGLLSEVCGGTYGGVNPQACYDDLQKQSQAIISGPTSVQGPKLSSTNTYNRPDGTLGSTATTTSTTYNIRYGDTYYDYDTVTTKTTTQDGTQTGQETTTDQGDPQQKPDEDKPEEEKKPERLTSGEPCDVPLSCSGDAIDCAVLSQEKSLRCAYEAQSDYDKHKDEIKTAVTGQKFEIDDSSEIQIPSFINQGTRFLPAACPTANTLSLASNGGYSLALSYEPLCAGATDLGYLFVIGVAVYCVLYVGRSLGGE